MPTETLTVDPERPDEALLERAARVLRAGGLVAFPTETVYGLGADALQKDAVARIFVAKGRPADNPLIVHVASVEEMWHVAAYDGPWRRPAETLAQRWWPGPLTLILPKKSDVPDEVTGGLPTVAVRVPDHPVALGLLRATQRPVAAPSANRSGRPSPTEARHVVEDLAGRIDLIVDGGPATIGLESTVLDLSGTTPIVHRPGAVTVGELAAALGRAVRLGGQSEVSVEEGGPPPSPGLKYVHYAPDTPCILVEGPPDAVEETLREELAVVRREGRRIGLLTTREGADALRPLANAVCVAGARGDVAAIARNVYRCLRELDHAAVDVIYMEGVAAEGLGEAVMNRLRRAAGRRIVRATPR